jgi:cytidine deaminase
VTKSESDDTTQSEQALIDAARSAAAHAHAPYSNFSVGAAALARDGRVFVGCNVENVSYPAGMCAERTAIGAMVAAGAKELATICVYTDTNEPTMPCGFCRQVIREFGENVDVICATPHRVERTTLRELLPRAFTRADEP